MRTRTLAVIACLAAGWLLLPATTPLGLTRPARAGGPSARERKQLEAQARAYVREEDADARDRLWKDMARVAKKLSFADIEALVASAVPGETWQKGFTHDVSFDAGGESWSYSVHMMQANPGGLLPLVIDPGHGSLKDAAEDGIEDVMGTWLNVSGAGNQVIYLRTRVIDALSRDGRYDAWSTPRRPAGKENLDSIAAILMAAARDACLRYPVDPNRVYVHGISQTGFWAWWLGTYAPDRFAGVAPVSSVTWHVRKLLQNLQATQVYILHGTEDPVCPFGQAQGAAEDLKRMKAPVDFRPIEGGEHVKGVFPRWRELWPAMAEAPRNPYPKRIDRRLVSGSRGDVFWLRGGGVPDGEFNPWSAPSRLKGRVFGRTVDVEAFGCRTVTVMLATPLLDLEQRIEIRLNGKKAWKGKAEPDLRRALDVARERGDGAGFSAFVDLEVP